MSKVHNIEIGVTVDEESIKETVITGAAKQIERGLFPNGFTTSTYYGANRWSDEFRNLVSNKVNKLFEESKKDIVEEAAKIVADRLMRSKIFKSELKKEDSKE